MPMPRQAEELLDAPNMAVIATLRPDGHPHAVPTWYEWSGGHLLVNMDRTRRRLEHLRLDPRVALTVMLRDDWYSHISFLGDVVELRDDPDLADIDRISLRYRGEPYRNRQRESVTALIRPRSWFGWGRGETGG
jgi:PPOX class probable F420-dependent enzyme